MTGPRVLALGLALGVTVACGPPAASPGLVPDLDPLGYVTPPDWPSYYTVADTAVFTVNSGAMGRMTVSAAYAGTARLELTESGETFRATIGFPSFRGSFQAAPDMVHEVDEADIGGEFAVRVDPRGRTELLETPDLSDRALDVTGPESLIRPLFVQLPGRPAAPGDVWVDTVVAIEDAAELRSTVQAVITTTLVGDTVMDDGSFLLLRTRAENLLELEGRSGGVRVRQRLSGTTTGTVVWDDGLHRLVERREDGRLTGTLEIPGAGVDGFPMAAVVRRHVLLQRPAATAPDPAGR